MKIIFFDQNLKVLLNDSNYYINEFILNKKVIEIDKRGFNPMPNFSELEKSKYLIIDKNHYQWIKSVKSLEFKGNKIIISVEKIFNGVKNKVEEDITKLISYQRKEKLKSFLEKTI